MTLILCVLISYVYMCPIVPPYQQEQCRDCGKWTIKHRHRSHRCLSCRYKHEKSTTSPTTPLSTTEQQMTKNVSNMMSLLPIHSHHRAPLVHHLSKGLDSTTASNILNTTSSYVRQCK